MLELPVATWVLNGSAAFNAHDPDTLQTLVRAFLAGAGEAAVMWDGRLTGSGDGKEFLLTLDIDADGGEDPPFTYLCSEITANVFRATTAAQLEQAIAQAREDGELDVILILRCDATSGDGREWWSIVFTYPGVDI